MRRNFVILLVAVVVSGVAIAGGRVWNRWQVRSLAADSGGVHSATIYPSGVPSVRLPGYVFTGVIATFEDELFAYLMYQHHRQSSEFAGDQLLLCYQPGTPNPIYEVLLVNRGDFLDGIDRLSQLYAAGKIDRIEWRELPKTILERYARQTRLFVSAYNLPPRRAFDQLPRNELRRLVKTFVRYKSTTDPRILRNIEPVPKPLSPQEAHVLAGDVIAVASFYDLPLEFFLGVGAMENNYMNVRGDLEHSIWKRRPAKDDIVLQRRRGRVRVLNDAAGPWQITRETLRYAHRLYLKDTRDYTLLPEHLRPVQGKELILSDVPVEVLTTYAGLILRDLLDRFNGDVQLAIGAYNGGEDHPNMQYEAGVRAAAAHARRIMEQAAALYGQSAAATTWLSPH